MKKSSSLKGATQFVFWWLGILLYMLGTQLVAQAAPSPLPPYEYHLQWDGQSSQLQVLLRYTPVSRDSTVFVFDEVRFGGQLDIFKVLEQVRGEATDRLKLLPSQHKIIVQHAKPGRHELRYVLNGAITDPPGQPVQRELFRPVIKPGCLYLVSEFFVLKPQHCPPVAISLQFDRFPKQATYFLSLAPHATPGMRQVLTPAQADEWLLVLGSDLVRREYQVHGIPYYSVTSRRDTLNNMEQELAPYFTRYFPALRTFWKDDESAYYYVCLLPTYNTGIVGGGFGWGPGFMMKYAGPFDNWKKEVVAHETSHYWIGTKLVLGDGSMANQWFGEGFNDYMALTGLAASSIFDATAFLEYFNQNTARAHYTSPVLSAPNDSIARNYWRSRDYQKLPYRRGLLYAFYLDNQVRLASSGQHTLRDVLLALYARNKNLKAKDPAAKLTVEDFLDAAGQFVPREQVAQQVRTYMLQGKPLDFHQIQLVPAFHLTFEGEVPVLGLSATTPLTSIYRWE